MKSTLDSNVFIYGSVSNKCSELLMDVYDRSISNMILRSVREETYEKLIYLSSMINHFLDELRKSEPDKLIESDYYKSLRFTFPQIYDALKEYVKNHEREDIKDQLFRTHKDINYIIKILSRENLIYPVEEDYDYPEDIEIKLKKFISNDKDCRHLTLCHKYITENLRLKEKLKFITLDKKDFQKGGKKKNIEKLIKNLIVEILDFNYEVKL